MNNFSRLGISSRLYLLVSLTLVGLVILCVTALFQLKDSMLEGRKDKLKSQVETATGVLTHFQKLAVAGKLGEEEAKTLAKETLRQMRYSGNEYFFIYHTNGVNFLLPVKPEFEGQNKWDLVDKTGKFFLQALIKTAQGGGGFVEYMWDRSKDLPPEPKMAYSTLFAPWDLMIGTGVFIDDIDKAYWKIAQIFGFISLCLLILLSLFGWWIGKGVIRQLGGEPAEAAAIMQRVAGGDLTARLDNRPAGSLLHSLDKMVDALRSMMADIRQDADNLERNASYIASTSANVAQAAEQQSDATSAMAAAIEQLTVSSNHISDSARDTSADSQEAVQLSGQGAERVGMAVEAIQNLSGKVSDVSTRIRSLEARAQQISSIANVIKDIAGQTNLLALNAAIEAARAGEQGRGFAVVADEVRKLAERTSSATTEIEQMIGGIQSDTVDAVQAMDSALPEVDQGVRLAESASESLRAIEDGARRTLERIDEVANATLEQSSAATSIAQRVEQIANMVEETTQSIRQTSATANQLGGLAGNLKTLISRFRV